MKKVKTAFLILRVDAEFKQNLVEAAAEVGESISEFVRKALTKNV